MLVWGAIAIWLLILFYYRIIDLFYQDFLKKEEEELNKQKLKSDIKDSVDKLYNEMIATLGSKVAII